ncbi:MAG: ABC transporter permease, partial [Clostridia bacterium]|nr:ABC transporter permease [Clostridia bacterium]
MKKNLSYLIKQGFRNIWVNKLMSFASISVLVACLMLVGGAMLLYVNIQAGIKYVGSLGEIALFVDDSMTEVEIDAITQTLEAMPQLAEVNFISREEGLEQLKQEITGGEDLFAMLGSDILPNSYRVRVGDSKDYDAMVTRLSQIYGISDVVANGKIANTLTDLSNSVALFGAAMVSVMLVVSVFILTNTIKLAMYARRREIYIMKMVGATNSFVRVPFFVEGVALGLISALVS